MTVRPAREPSLRDTISVTEAAAKMSEHPSTVRALLQRGLIEGYAGGLGTKKPRYRIYVDSIVDYQSGRTVKPKAAAAAPPTPKPARQSAAYREAIAALRARGLNV